MSPPPSRLLARICAAFVAVALGATASVLLASPSSAHGGPVMAQAGAAGGGGVYVYIVYERDLHAVEDLKEVTVEGSQGERSVGRTTLTASDSAAGRWESASGTFTEGEWQLTVRYTPEVGDSQTLEAITVTVVGGGSASSAAGISEVWPLMLGAGLAAALLTVLFVAIARRRSTRRQVREPSESAAAR